MRTTLTLLGLLGGVALLSACKGAGGGGADSGKGGSSSGVGSGGQGGDELVIDAGPNDGTDGLPKCHSAPGEDSDDDGFTGAAGDCNDCDPNVNPGAIEVVAASSVDGGVPAAVDEDCDGMVDEVDPPCDIGLDVADNEPLDAARAVDLCHFAAFAKDWGVVSARWTLADGAAPPVGNANFDLGHGLLKAFGPNVKVQSGARMLGLSSGAARQIMDPGFQSVGGFDKGYTGGSPQGFPKESPACPGKITGEPHDAAGVEIVVRAPSNAHGFSFNFNFFTYEWPNYICTKYNDFFVALLSPIPAGQVDGNISFDSQGNPVSVNNAFLEVCGCAPQGGPPCIAGGKAFSCSLGNSGLAETGFQEQFQDHGSTGWLFTRAPVTPGEQITLRWAVYDSADGALDSTTLIDNWQWIAEPGTHVGTGSVPTPK